MTREPRDDEIGSGQGVTPILEPPAADEWVRSGVAGGPDREVRDTVRAIIEDVRRDGDEAVLEYTERLDGVEREALRVPQEACREALEALSDERREALERARRNIRRVHEAQRRSEEPVSVEPGVEAWREFRPIDRVGIYAPGGAAPYPSSLLMSAVPARVAGCREIVAFSPPGPDGSPPEAVRAAAALVGVDALFAAGGAQAVAAMAIGTGAVPRVDKIFGPGSTWVNAAKLELFAEVDVDLPAGPSEVVVWGDAETRPDWAAAELLAQAEHGPDSLSVGVLPSREKAGDVREELVGRLEELPRRSAAEASLGSSALLVAPDEARAVAWINEIAPEHLAILRRDGRSRASEVRSAGGVFVGPATPVAAGDYAAGTNHVLPTGRRARGTGGLSLDDFGRWVQFQEITPEGLRALGPSIVELAEWEGFRAHADSVRVRLDEFGDGRTGEAT
ncbi:MAG: histidinol dehydrogenase [Candidatus Palauibacterales bacterium]|nr:histidinol dehydrogenase [Candidatus Palauibacterales bacterium]